jgi:hypothetical protein
MRIPFIGNPSNASNQARMQVTLTPQGLQSAEGFEGQGTKYEILATLMARRPLSIGMLSKEAQIGYGECFKACKALAQEGYISVVQRQGMQQ